MNQVYLSSRFASVLWVAAVLTALSGCVKSDAPQYRLNTVAMDLSKPPVPETQRQSIANILTAMFGTPDDPIVLPETGLDPEKIKLAAGPTRVDAQGVERGLYRRHCGHCHGTSGDGYGPTAAILNPYPRDYRPGIYKFKSTERGVQPTDADLRRIIHDGIIDTAMPSFDVMLTDAQIDALVEYVKFLSLRGMVELNLVNVQVPDLGVGENLKTDRDFLMGILQEQAGLWAQSKDHIVAIPDRPDMELAKSIEKGRELFYTDRANCTKCHGISELGDGQTDDYDDWNKPLYEADKGLRQSRKQLAEDKNLLPAARAESLKDLAVIEQAINMALPIRTIKPRNLREGHYRGGRRPIDLYRRIYVGINGVPMPGAGPATPGGQGKISDDEIWNLVDYVRSLPYESLSRPPRQSNVVKERN